ncbi:MAG: terminase small subunit, partial [Bacteroidota bacterium]|nr:terminase small subunit [Bacteroidota bacterium]
TDRTGIVSVGIQEMNNIKYQTVIIKDFSELSEEQKACISGVKKTKNGIEITFYNKEKALELLGRHLGMFNDKIQLSGEIKSNNPFEGLTTEELKRLANG